MGLHAQVREAQFKVLPPVICFLWKGRPTCFRRQFLKARTANSHLESIKRSFHACSCFPPCLLKSLMDAFSQLILTGPNTRVTTRSPEGRNARGGSGHRIFHFSLYGPAKNGEMLRVHHPFHWHGSPVRSLLFMGILKGW